MNLTFGHGKVRDVLVCQWYMLPHLQAKICCCFLPLVFELCIMILTSRPTYLTDIVSEHRRRRRGEGRGSRAPTPKKIGENIFLAVIM